MGDGQLSKSQLAHAMGYKGITAKLSGFIAEMIKTGALEQVPVGSQVKIRAAKK